jgi:hypothetical protein
MKYQQQMQQEGAATGGAPEVRTDDSKARRRAHHELKSWPDSFGAVLDGTKRHEVRNSDREFAPGDTVVLREFIPDQSQAEGHTTGRYTGREWHGAIGYLSLPGSFGLPLSLCVFTIIERFS